MSPEPRADAVLNSDPAVCWTLLSLDVMLIETAAQGTACTISERRVS